MRRCSTTLDEPIDELAAAGIATTVADLLVERAEGPPRARSLDIRSVELAREYLAAHAAEQTRAGRRSRRSPAPTASRSRATSGGRSARPPTATGMLRRLALARTAIESGRPLARAAAEAGFADQSHLTRQFKRSYGLTPAVWARLTAPR